MNVKTSIVIPHYGDRAHDLLKPCLDSIRKYSDDTMYEVIVVANGCTQSTHDLIIEFHRSDPLFPVDLLWFDEALGYTRACNEGMKIAKGEYIVLLNNDTEILPSPKNLWIDMLLQAFWDSRCAVSGPMMAWCPYAEHHFLIGFCTMFRKEALDQIGLYDESFEAYGEDTDICIRAKRSGWKIKQVPDDHIQRLPGQPSVGTGNFPIWHKGNESYRNWPGGEELLAKNRAILKNRYATGIGKAYETDGFMSPSELRWLAERAKTSCTVIEVGSWHGRSTRAIADNLPSWGVVYAVDTWAGSKTEQDTNHASARGMDGDAAYVEFCQNLWEHIESGRVVPLRLHGCHAANLLKRQSVAADFIFIDGGHSKGETLTDIALYLPLLKKGGVIAGHDYRNGLWPDVTKEVLSVFGSNVGNPENTTIWYTDSGGATERVFSGDNASNVVAPRVYDCFTFFNELDILEIRFNELWNTVDRFVIVEATKTHQGNPKPLYFQENLKRFEKFLSKVTHVVDEFPDEMETGGGPCFPSGMNWARERHQREAIMRGLQDCKDDDVIIISDADEIPRSDGIRNYIELRQQYGVDLMRMEMNLYCYYLNCSGGEWREAKILPYSKLKELGPCNTRYSLHTIGTHGEPLWNAGWHFSFMGGPEAIREKIQSYGHGEYARPEILDLIHLKRCIENGKDVFNREGFEYRFVELNGHYPKYVTDNLEHFVEIGFINVSQGISQSLEDSQSSKVESNSISLSQV